MTTATLPDVISPDAVAEVLGTVRQHAADCDRDSQFPDHALNSFRTQGLLGLLAPHDHGGLGGSRRDLVAITQMISREDLSAGMIFAMHCQQVATIAAHATGTWRDTVLQRVARGECFLASVTTDPRSGGDVLRPAAGLIHTTDGMQLCREAPVVTGGLRADGFVITMNTPGGAGDRASLIYADRSQLTLERLGDWQAMGMRATESVAIRLTGSIPDNQVIGELGQFRKIALTTYAPLAHLGWAAAWLGAAAGAVSRTAAYLRNAGRAQLRERAELPLCRLARARSHVDTVHAVLQHVLGAVDLNENAVTNPSMQLALNNLKIVAAEHCLAAVDQLIDLVGMKHGYLATSPLFLERVHRDLRSATLNISNDRLAVANGRLALLDMEVSLV